MITCLFEQSGHFKKVFQKYNYDAVDIDIENQYGETDIITDLFQAIENGTIKDYIQGSNFVMCFFPCTWFSDMNDLIIRGNQYQMQKLQPEEKKKISRERKEKQKTAAKTLLKLIAIAEEIKIPMIIENPNSVFIDKLLKGIPYELHKRGRYGDYFTKPTRYYFIGDITIAPFMETMKNELHLTIDQMRKNERNCKRKLARSIISEMYIDNLIRNIYKPSEWRYYIDTSYTGKDLIL